MKNITGLNDQQVEESRSKYGSNKMSEQASETFMQKLLGNFGDPMIKILLVALIINVIFAIFGKADWIETIGIAAAVLIATLVSTFSEYRNENAFQALQAEASQIKCKIYRNGEIVEIPIDEIVVGDAVLLQSGDKIPADGVLIDGNIKVDQSVLNGESEEAKKESVEEVTEEAGQSKDFLHPNKVFRGAVVCSGNAVMQVTTVGDKTIYGEIAKELQTDEDRETPLKLKLGKLANQISVFGYIGGAAIAVAFMIQCIVNNEGGAATYFTDIAGIFTDLVEAVILAVIIIVMAVPEGLPLMIAIVSAQNMGKMLKENVLVRKISGIETAGSLNLLMSDKTGTITKGQLEVVNYTDGAGNAFDNYNAIGEAQALLMRASIFNNTSAVISGQGAQRQAVGGNMTERALLNFVKDVENNDEIKIIDSVPFNSTNKFSLSQVEGAVTGTLIKGAPEKIIDRCKYYYDTNGQKQPFDSKLMTAKIDELAVRAIRVLAFAISDGGITEEGLPAGEWTLVGITGIRDDVRPESIEAIAQVQKAGVQVIMITGDRKETAVAIAKEAGIIRSDDDVRLTSDELNALSDEEVKKIMPKLRVVARALPTDKSRLVRIAQELDLVVGMTGDGVNDSPALKKADVGFAMGGGTEVAKEASEIVILDDNFLSIEKAILFGRTIFNSIRKFIVFQLTINVSAVLVSFVCPLLGIDHPLSITQILWVNLVMDTLAALAFGGEPALKEYMDEKPKRRDEPIVSKYMWTEIITGALWSFGLSMFFILSQFMKDWFRADEVVSATQTKSYLLTGYFAFFILIAVANAFNARTEKMNLFDNITGNKGFLKVMGGITLVQIIMTYIGGAVLRCYGMNAKEWCIVLILALTIIPVDLIRKAIVGSKKAE
ncbi:MAG: calcium-translocating P-type ATPase, PMCA-type [Oscillospiraceae bacterium]|nr:calcium-translocating P-type ATPase, PMCA-type [Oscillospiraceae bacterium]